MKLRAQGNKLVRVDTGAVVILRGANVINYSWKYKRNKSDYDFDLRAIDALLTPVEQGGWNGTAATIWIASGPILRAESAYLAYLDEAVEVAFERGGYLIVSWSEDEPDEGTHPYLISTKGIEAHRAVAARYKDIPNVLHACQAEPGEWVSSSNLTRWRNLRDRQEATIDAIREAKPDACVGVSGTEWSQNVGWMVEHPVRRENIWVKPHIYAEIPGAFESNGVWAVSGAGYPVVIGEFGSGGRMTNADSHGLMRLCEENQMGHQAWNFNNEGPPLLLKSKNPGDRTSYGNLVYEALRAAKDEEGTGPVEPPPPPPTLVVPFRLNCGGPSAGEFKDESLASAACRYEPTDAQSASHEGEVMVPDVPEPQAVWTTERWGMQRYIFRVEPGMYDVRVLCAETYSGITGPGERVFDVSVQGSDVKEVDAYAQAGFAKALPIWFYEASVGEDKELLVEFYPKTENPAVKGIEIWPHDSEREPGPEPPPDEEEPEPKPENPELEDLKERIAEAEERLMATDGRLDTAGKIIVSALQELRDITEELRKMRLGSAG